MSNQPNVGGINKVVKDEEKKDEYKPDERIKRIYEAKREYARKARQEKFKRWLNEYTDQNIKINEVLCNLCKDIESFKEIRGYIYNTYLNNNKIYNKNYIDKNLNNISHTSLI